MIYGAATELLKTPERRWSHVARRLFPDYMATDDGIEALYQKQDRVQHAIGLLPGVTPAALPPKAHITLSLATKMVSVRDIDDMPERLLKLCGGDTRNLSVLLAQLQIKLARNARAIDFLYKHKEKQI